jgi:hypothetical protein
MRLILRAPGHLNGKQIGEMFGVTKQAISIQAKGMLAFVDKRRQASVQAQLDAAFTPVPPPGRESSKTPPRLRVASTPRRKKERVFRGFDGFSKKPQK